MGRNKTGGNRHKKQGRKHINQDQHREKLRLACQEGEQYAKVIKINGGGTADIFCNDGIVRLLVIRKKFRGRNKRDNQIKLHTVILVGIRMWEVVASNKKPKADLLYIYSNGQLPQLCKIANINQILLPEEMQTKAEDNGGFEFGNNVSTLEQTNDLDIGIPSNKEPVTTIVFDDDTNWDDI